MRAGTLHYPITIQEPVAIKDGMVLTLLIGEMLLALGLMLLITVVIDRIRIMK
jgi:hypothetical protein